MRLRWRLQTPRARVYSLQRGYGMHGARIVVCRVTTGKAPLTMPLQSESGLFACNRTTTTSKFCRLFIHSDVSVVEVCGVLLLFASNLFLTKKLANLVPGSWFGVRTLPPPYKCWCVGVRRNAHIVANKFDANKS